MVSAAPLLLAGAGLALLAALICAGALLWRRVPAFGWAALTLLVLGLGLSVLAHLARLT